MKVRSQIRQGARPIDPRDPRDPRSGVALLVALVVVVLLTVIVVEFAYETQVEASLATNRDEAFLARLSAKSAVAEGVALLATDLYVGDEELLDVDTTVVDSYLDPWFTNANAKELNGAQMRTTVDDEYGKINLNALFYPDPANPEGFVRNEWLELATREFFRWRNPEADADALVDAIIDWLDTGDGDAVEQSGAEMDYYQGLEIPYPCKNGFFDSVEELLLIKGMTPELYFGDAELAERTEDGAAQLPLSEFFTVHGDWEGKINVNTAPRDVLLAVFTALQQREGVLRPDIDPKELADSLVYQHQFGDDEVPPVPMYNVRDELLPYFQAGGNQRGGRNNVAQPPQVNQQNIADSDLVTEPGFYFRSNSYVFRVLGDGLMNDTMVRIEAYVWRSPLDPAELEGGGLPDEPFRYLSWRVIG